MVVMMFAMAATVSLVSCGGDDDEEGGSASTTAGVFDKSSGLRLSRYGYVYYDYDTNGRLSEISGGSFGFYRFSYNPNKITSYYNNEVRCVMDVSYNGSGYITRINYSYNNGTGGSNSYSYDKGGHLTKITSTSTDTEHDGGVEYNITYDETTTFTWSNNRLTRAIWVCKETGGSDGTVTDTEDYIFNYDGDYDNPFRQWTPSLTFITGFETDFEECVASVGLFGIGPVELPSSCSYSETDTSSSYNDGNDYTFRYTYNNNGTVNTTYINGYGYSFSYDYVGSDSNDAKTRASVGVPSMTNDGQAGFHGLFSHKHKHHRRM